MAREATSQGFDFLERLRDEWKSGSNRFDRPGELLLGAFADEELIAVGGLNRDPFLHDPSIGRLRRIFVCTAWRGQGVGAKLVELLISQAHSHFRQVRLRAATPASARIYERLGFRRVENDTATHLLTF